MESNYMFYSQKRIFAYKLGNFSYGQGRSSLPGTLVCPPSLEKRGARAPPPQITCLKEGVCVRL